MKKVRFITYAIGAILLGSSLALAPLAAHADDATEQTLEIYGGIIDETHPINSQDEYTEASTDEGVTWHPAYLVGGNHPWGNVDGTNSWLNCAPSFFECLGVRSDYRYRFFLPEGWRASKMIADMKIDNYGWISLNGVDVSGRQAFAWHSDGPIDLDALTHTGWNELHVVLVDEGGWAGINFHLTYTVTSPAPIKVMKPGLPSTLDVLFDLEGAPGSISKEVYTLGGDPVTLPTPTRSGYTFLGWGKGSTDGLILDPGTYVPDDNITMHAIWDALPVEEDPVPTLAETGETSWPLALAAISLILLGMGIVRFAKKN
jgi:uncharacterized repeat protein (TIGR02543 family)